MTDEPTVGVLGAGIMGAAMARNLVRAGHAVRVWNRSPDKAAGTGATVAASPSDAVRDADVIITMLYDGGTVRDVIRQATPGLKAGALWLQTTTASLADVAGLAGVAAEHGVAFYDAPVLGTREPAEAGRLTVLAAGPASGRERLAPVLDAIAARVVWLGEDGARGDSTRLKLVANGWVLTVTHGAAELLALAGALGVDPDRFFEVIKDGPLDLGYLHTKTDLVRQGRLSPASFAVGTAEKDARLIVAAGLDHGVRLDVVAAGAERFRRAAEQGHGDEDMAASYYASFTP
ncbi:NAD(P)-dependent oxidoreductase [Micromonospora sp. NBC_00421]|uniref:NAD(P)-dependent oxidoreductase n=1 Tax=Micromonospora sp. NBC_00421 TaxID=2975976 RepID=UPI002E1F6EDA